MSMSSRVSVFLNLFTESAIETSRKIAQAHAGEKVFELAVSASTSATYAENRALKAIEACVKRYNRPAMKMVVAMESERRRAALAESEPDESPMRLPETWSMVEEGDIFWMRDPRCDEAVACLRVGDEAVPASPRDGAALHPKDSEPVAIARPPWLLR